MEASIIWGPETIRISYKVQETADQIKFPSVS